MKLLLVLVSLLVIGCVPNRPEDTPIQEKPLPSKAFEPAQVVRVERGMKLVSAAYIDGAWQYTLRRMNRIEKPETLYVNILGRYSQVSAHFIESR